MSKGCKYESLDSIGIDCLNADTLLISIVNRQMRKAMDRLLSTGFGEIYVKCCGKKETALQILVTRATEYIIKRDEYNYNEVPTGNTCVDMFCDFCWYILTHCDQFGGEIKVLEHIMNDTTAAQLILNFQIDPTNKIRQQFVQIAHKNDIRISVSHSKLNVRCVCYHLVACFCALFLCSFATWKLIEWTLIF